MLLNHGNNLVCLLHSLPCATSKHEGLQFLFPSSKSSLTSFGIYFKKPIAIVLKIIPLTPLLLSNQRHD